MQTSPILTVVLPIALAVVMLGLGLSLTWADFRRVGQYPRAVLGGLAVQALVLPAVAIGLAYGFHLAPALAVGLVLLAASPGGATANLYSHLAGGDVALNLTLTATNSVLSVVAVPALVGLAMHLFMAQERGIPLQFGKIISVLAIVLLPVAIGMTLRKKQPKMAAKLDQPVKIASIGFLVFVIAAAIWQYRADLGGMFADVGVPALLFNVASLGIGYLVPRLLKLEDRQAAAIALEIGIHNEASAIAVAGTVLNDMKFAAPAMVYSLIMYGTATLFTMWVKRRIVPDLAVQSA